MERWWRDKSLLRTAVAEYGSLEAAVRAIGGCHPSTAQKSWRALGMEKLTPGPPPTLTVNQEALKSLHQKVYG